MSDNVDYGRDISVTTSLRTGRFATNLQVVGEACYRRLTTPRGMLRGGEDEANYGLDLTELIGSSNPVQLAQTLSGRIRSELLKDERVDSVDVLLTRTTVGPATTFNIVIDVTTAAGPFTLQLLANAVTTSLLGITAT